MNNEINKLFQTIYNTKEYKEYLKIKNELLKSKRIMNLIDEIKRLQQQATKLENEDNLKYQTIDKIIAQKLTILNNNPLYREFITKKDKLNSILTYVSSTINDYLEKIIE